MLEPAAESVHSGERMSHSVSGVSTPAKVADWAKGMALGNVASSPMDSAVGLDRRPVWDERTVIPSSKTLYHLLSQFILAEALGSLNVVGPILHMRKLGLRESHKTVALS